MQRTLKATALILMLYVLGGRIHCRASASATTGFPSLEKITATSIDTQVLPQSGGFTVRQWVFPSMVFNCTGNITRWIFRAQETGLDNGMFPQISTWRNLVSTASSTTDFQRVSVSGSAEELTGDGPVYEYVLQEPVSVQEGDILGIGLPVVNFQNNVEQLDFEFLDMGDGNAPDSYRRRFFARSIDTTRFVTRDRQYVPLITAVIGFPDGSSTSTVFPTSTPPPTPTQGSQTTPPQTDDSGLGSGLAPGITPTPTISSTTPPTTSPGSPLNMAVIIGPAIAASVLVIFTIVIIVSVIRLIHSKQIAGELYALGTKENEVYGTNSQTQHITTAANEPYGCVGNIPVVENEAYTPAAVNVPTVQNEAYGSVSGAALNTDTEEQDEMYDYVNN